MWTWPKDTPINIRRVEKPLRELVERASPTGDGYFRRETWDGDRLQIQITDSVGVEQDSRNRTVAQLYNIHTGYPNPATIEIERYGADLSGGRSRQRFWTGTIDPGDIFLVRKNTSSRWSLGGQKDDNVLIYLSCLWQDDLTKDVLDVARDQALSANDITPDVYKLAREALPRAHGLFIALLRKELAGF